MTSIKVYDLLDCKFCGGVETVEVWSMDGKSFCASCEKCEMMYPPKDSMNELYDIIKRTTVKEMGE